MTTVAPRTADRIATRGSGLGYRHELAKEMAANADRIDVVEILADQWTNPRALDRLREIAGSYPTVPHGVCLSLAGAGRIDEDYLLALRRIIEACGADYYSEHLTVTHVPGLDSDHLCAPIINADSLRACVRNVTQTQDALGVPLAIENITYSVSTGTDDLAGASFLADLVTETDALILLDVANLYINSHNHRFDPLAYLARLPMEKIVHIHLAGGISRHGLLHDTHSEIIGEEVWQLAEEVGRLSRPKTVIVEHDTNFPLIDTLVEEVARGREIFFGAEASERD
jgi:uncharacterized protein (UPF0276 family)